MSEKTFLELGKWKITGWPATILITLLLLFLNLPAFMLGYSLGVTQ